MNGGPFMYHNPFQAFISSFRKRPHAIAMIKGSRAYPGISGIVRFYQTQSGVLVVSDITGLPIPSERCRYPIFGFHIHGGGSCTGSEGDPFADTLTHFDPRQCPHPYHAGDLPALFGAGGEAFSAVLTDRFTVNEVVGRTVVIHAMPDDFTTQPAGGAGEKIACGVIRW